MSKTSRGFVSLGLSIGILGLFFSQKDNIVNCMAGTMAYSMQMMTATALGEEYSFPEPTCAGDKWAQQICTVMLNSDEQTDPVEAQEKLTKIMQITGISNIKGVNETQELVKQYEIETGNTGEITGGWAQQ